MKHPALHKCLAITLAAGGMLAQTASALVTIETVVVGNAGNAGDSTGYGVVGYDYAIGKYEVTISQYTEFLNAVAATDTYGLYSPEMGTNLNISGILRSGVSGSYTYSVLGSGKKPVTCVNWYDAARFANWLQNGQPAGLQAAGTTETGAYTLNGNLGTVFRNAVWKYGLPSEDEWYKAAYHQPASQGGDSDNYWLYPTANNAIPNSRNGSATDANSGNFFLNDNIGNGFNGGYAVTDSFILLSTQNYLMDGGAFSLAASFYGTFDQGGNVAEWNDGMVVGAERAVRGGSWSSGAASLRASSRFGVDREVKGSRVGFRVVMLPVVASPVLNLERSGNTLTFSWSGNFKLQAQTNSLNLGLGTNWSDYPSGGSSPVVLELDLATPAVLFRLSSP